MGNEQFKSTMRAGRRLSVNDFREIASISGFTEDQVQEWYIVFMKDCPNGKMSKKQFIEIYEQFYPNNGKATKFCEHIFRVSDLDNSGSIEFGEYLLAVSITAQHDLKTTLEWAFTMYDIDQNGYIERNEMKKVLEAIFDLLGEERISGEKKDKKIEQILVKFDKNHDGKLSKEEFINGCLEDEYLRKFLVPSSR